MASLTFIFETETLLEISCERLSVSAFYLSVLPPSPLILNFIFNFLSLSLRYNFKMLHYSFGCFYMLNSLNLCSSSYLFPFFFVDQFHNATRKREREEEWSMQFQLHRLANRQMNAFGEANYYNYYYHHFLVYKNHSFISNR